MSGRMSPRKKSPVASTLRMRADLVFIHRVDGLRRWTEGASRSRLAWRAGAVSTGLCGGDGHARCGDEEAPAPRVFLPACGGAARVAHAPFGGSLAAVRELADGCAGGDGGSLWRHGGAREDGTRRGGRDAASRGGSLRRE